MLEVLKALFEHRKSPVSEPTGVWNVHCVVCSFRSGERVSAGGPDKAKLQRTVSVIIMSRWVNVALWVVVAGKEQSNQKKVMISSVQNLHAPKSHHKSNRYDEPIN